MPKKRVVVPSYLTWTKLAGRWRTASLTVCSWSDGAKSVRNMDLLTENSFFYADFTTDRAPAARGRWACSRSATRRRREDPCSFAKGAPRHSTPRVLMHGCPLPRSGLNRGLPGEVRSVSGSRQTALMTVSMFSKAEAHSSSSNLTVSMTTVPSRSRDGEAVAHE